LIAFRNVSKTYKNGTLALSGLNLEVREREFLTLLGPSGCGKSTVLRLIARLDRPTQGEIIGAPRDAADISTHVGFVFQEPTLLPWASVFDNVFLPLRLRGKSRNASAPEVHAALSLVGLDTFAKAYPRELSGGMRMRVSLARALVMKPRLLLLDEPFAALDELTRFRLNDDLIRLKQELGTTIVFVTHSIYESVYLSSRILTFTQRPGRIFSEIEIPETIARNEAFRLSPNYAALCAKASAALQTASGFDTTQVTP